MLLGINLVILVMLLLLLTAEELRFRGLKRRVEERRRSMTAIAHQLRTPLTSLRKFRELLTNQKLGKLSLGQMEALGKMDASAGEVAVLLNRLLALSRIHGGEIVTDVATVDLRENVWAAVDAVASFSEQKKQKLSYTEPRKKMTVTLDPLLLHGILDELLFNAVAYTPEKGTITVSLSAHPDHYDVAVEDTGIGIAPDDQKHIFESFYRGKNAAAHYHGNGLGLPFAKQFADEIGAKIAFESTEGKGSVFTVRIPKTSA